MWRKRLRWIVPIGVLVIAVAAGLVWVFSGSGELTAEEQPYVGWWTTSDPYPNLKCASPIVTDAVEYRPDRTVHLLRRNTQTGEVFLEESGTRWRVTDDVMTNTVNNPYPVSTVLSGDFQFTLQTVYRITWDGLDRYKMDAIELPPGVTWPTFVQTRRDPPANP
jgi:hypothetical protein